MKKLLSYLTIAALAAAFTTTFAADQGKKAEGNKAKKVRTIRGEAVCGKCFLHKTDQCQDVVQVIRKNKKGKEIKRYFWLTNNQIAKDAHGKFFCKGGHHVAVKGTVKKEGKGKNAKWHLTATNIKEYTPKKLLKKQAKKDEKAG